MKKNLPKNKIKIKIFYLSKFDPRQEVVGSGYGVVVKFGSKDDGETADPLVESQAVVKLDESKDEPK